MDELRTVNLVIIICLCISSSVLGQVLKVMDGDAPVPYVNVINQDNTWMKITDEKGEVGLEGADLDTLIISHIGYKTVILPIGDLNLQKVTIAQLELSMQPAPSVSILGSRIASKHQGGCILWSTVTTEDVKLYNPQTAADLLGQSGHILIQKSQQGGGSPMIRGYSANRLLYVVDGVRMNNAIFRSGNLHNVINLDPYSIDHTRILFGSQSVLYGSDAIGGVMNFISKSQEFSDDKDLVLDGNVATRFSSANKERTVHFDLGLSLKKWAFSSSWTRWNYGDLRQGSYGPEDYLKPYHVQWNGTQDEVIVQEDSLLQIPSAYSQQNIMNKIRFRPSSSHLWEYTHRHSETSSYGRYDRHNRIKDGKPYYGEWDYGPQKWKMHHLHYRNSGGYLLFDIADINVAYQRFDESRIDRLYNDIERNIRTESVDAFSANIDLKQKVNRKFTLKNGIEYIFNSVASVGAIEDIVSGGIKDGIDRYPQSDWSTFGLYFTQEYKFSEKLWIEGGIRYSHYTIASDFTNNSVSLPFDQSSLSDHAITYSLGIRYQLHRNLKWYGNFGTGFRAPNVDDMGKIFDSEPGAVVVPNPSLKSEYNYYVESTLKYSVPKKIELSLSGYYSYLNNAMVRRNSSLNGLDSILYDGVLSQVQSIQNGSYVRIIGLQANVKYHIDSHFNIGTHLNYLVGKEELNDGTISSSRHAPPFFGDIKVAYRKNNLSGFLKYQFQGQKSYEQLPIEERSKDDIYAKDINGNNYAPSWYSLNLKCLYHLTSNISFSAGIENITDRRYRTYSSGVSAPGRNWIIAFELEL